MILGALLITVSDAPICDITYDYHSYNSRRVIYNCISFIIQATGVSMTKTKSFLTLTTAENKMVEREKRWWKMPGTLHDKI
jgi:hypothetical protein